MIIFWINLTIGQSILIKSFSDQTVHHYRRLSGTNTQPTKSLQVDYTYELSII